MPILGDVTTPIAAFIPFKMPRINALGGIGSLATGGRRAMIAVLGVEMIIDMAVKAGRPVEPGA
jgi:hypothetical protein